MTEIEQPSPVDQLLDSIREAMVIQTPPYIAEELAMVAGAPEDRAMMALDILVNEGYLERSGVEYTLTPEGVTDQEQRRNEGTRT